MKVRIATRGSDLALAQTRIVVGLLERAHGGLACEVIVVRSHGDDHHDADLSGPDWPVGGFTSALERALVAGDADVAVHSYKDLPTQETPGLVIAAVPARGPVHDVLVTREALDLADPPAGLRIGTSSPRRAAQIGAVVPVPEVVPIRGNVPTRLGKVDAGEVDGVVLAAAGLARLGLAPANVMALDVGVCVPAPAQGALAVQARAGSEAEAALRAIDEAMARSCCALERGVLAAVGGGCHGGVGTLARRIEGGFEVLWSDVQGGQLRRGRVVVEDEAEGVARVLADMKNS